MRIICIHSKQLCALLVSVCLVGCGKPPMETGERIRQMYRSISYEADGVATVFSLKHQNTYAFHLTYQNAQEYTLAFPSLTVTVTKDGAAVSGDEGTLNTAGSPKWSTYLPDCVMLPYLAGGGTLATENGVMISCPLEDATRYRARAELTLDEETLLPKALSVFSENGDPAMRITYQGVHKK